MESEFHRGRKHSFGPLVGLVLEPNRSSSANRNLPFRKIIDKKTQTSHIG